MSFLLILPSSVYGLPLHPLVVHVAVVLVPLSALALIAVGWNKAWRHAYYPPIMLLALGGAAGTFLAKQTGGTLRQALRRAGKQLGDHPGEGDRAFILAGLFAAVCIALYVYEAYGDRLRERFGISNRYRLPFDENMTLYVMAVPIALLATLMMVLAGHSGAALVWKTAGSVTPTAGR